MRYTRTVAVLVLALFVVGCATLNMNAKPWADKTPKEKSQFFMSMYQEQFNDTMQMATNPTITEDQKKVVRTKKAILTRAWPLIQTYDSFAAGGMPSPELEAQILTLINQLVAAGGKL